MVYLQKIFLCIRETHGILFGTLLYTFFRSSSSFVASMGSAVASTPIDVVRVGCQNM